MKKTSFLAALGVSLLAINSAQAAEYAPYVSAKLGLSHYINNPHQFSQQDEDLLFGSLALGADFREMNINSNILMEVEYTYRPGMDINHKDGVNLGAKSRSLMLNGYYVIPARMEIKPFLSAGLGFTRNERDINYLDGSGHIAKKTNNLTWSLGAGALMPEVYDYTDLVFGYRYMDMGKMKTGRSNIDFESHEFYAGVNYKF